MMKQLEILGIDEFATIDEVKYAYRLLAKKYHPDSNKSIKTAQKFIEITNAYHWLLDNHKPKSRPVNIRERRKYYRLVDTQDKQVSITLPEKILEMDTTIFVMDPSSMNEVRFHLTKGTKIPIDLTVQNIQGLNHMHISYKGV